MKKSLFYFFILIFLCLQAPPFLSAAVAGEIEIIFDASGSMNDAMAGSTKLSSAKQVLASIAEQIPADSRVGLRLFGTAAVRDNIKESCTDSLLALPIAPFRKELMVGKVMPIASHGMTALGYSLELAGKDFSAGADVKKTIILISDGEETCGKDPLAVMAALKAQGIDIAIHAVGFGATEAAKGQLKKLADSTGGSYREAEDGASLLKSLQEVVQKEMLLTVQKDTGENLLAATSGARIVSSSTQEFAKLIDGNDQEISGAIYSGQEAVFSFKDNQPVMLESFSVPIFRVDNYNPGKMYLMGSTESSEEGFFPILDFKVENKVFFGNVYQAFKMDPPVAVRFLKVVVGPGSSGNQSYHTEWRASGHYLSEEAFAAETAKAGPREMNLLSGENGGQLIAAANMNFQYLIDGKAGSPGKAAEIQPPAEGIFGFSGNKTVLIKKLAVGVFEASQYNCKAMEFSVSTTSPTGEYTPLGTFEAANLVFAGNPYQEYVLDKPVQAKYLKVKVVSTYGMYYCNLSELQAVGTVEKGA